MTTMADSINPGALKALVASGTPHVDALLGYVDGRWPDYQAIAAWAKIPVYGLTVFGNPAIGDGTDSEPGDASISSTVTSTKGELARGVARPIVYCPASWATSMVAAHGAAGVARGEYRLLTAHYGAGEHICGPTTCRYGPGADGTQWQNGPLYDLSILNAAFLAAASHPGPEAPVTEQNKPIVKVAKAPVAVAGNGNGTVGGYWIVCADGGVFAFGGAPFHGSAANLKLSAPIIGLTPTNTGGGYWLLGADGAVYAFGDAEYEGRVQVS